MTDSTLSKFSKHVIVSKDDTKIGYLSIGQGPGLVLIHGGAATSSSLTKLGELLSDSFTVFIPDRRGRGMSGLPVQDHGLASEIEDVDALLRKTNARKVFGLSAGAIVVLQAALELPAISQVALFEPPLPVAGTSPTFWASRYEREVSQGKLGAALVTILKGTESVRAPRFILVPIMTRKLKKSDARARQLGVQPMSEVIPAMRRDIRIVEDSKGPIDRFRAMKCDVLLLGATKSPQYLKTALDELNIVLPNARRVTIPAVDHAAATNRGKPELVANELRTFFN